MKKVLFIITQSEYGGAQRFLHTVVPELDTSKYDVTVAFGKRSGQEFLEPALQAKGIKTHRFKHLQRRPHPLGDIQTLFEIRSYLMQHEPDTIFLLSSKAGFIGSLATVFPTRLKNIQVMYRIGGWAFTDPRPWWQQQLIMLVERFAATWKDIIITDNAFGLAEAQRLHIAPRKNLILVHNGIDTYKTTFQEKDQAQAALVEHARTKGIQLRQAKYIVGTVANSYATKGLPHLIQTARTFKNNDDVAFWIIGDGKDQTALQHMIMQQGLEHTVYLLGALEDAGQYLQAFDIFVLASLKEGMPWVVLEAMAAKLPIIATRVGALPEMIEDGKSGFLVDPARPAQMTHALEQLLSNDHLRQETGIQAHQNVIFKYTDDKMVHAIEELL